MAKTKQIRQDSTAVCLQFLRRSGGKARLSEISFSRNTVQKLLNQGLVKVQRTDIGYYLELKDVELCS
ncbi:hypothetical protein ACN23B_27125 (plasmid) [Anabaena sp. FACHB-709]|uniref:Uncharacterized protein n=2 Tax=Nostocaceae TaxID=1162 RepID=A0A1Z4KV55_ANAVA|nr:MULTISPECIES: hypothetical protein [Nostocaceae]BAY72773.1 hypothetical protein NIES23_56010 [Trichormus variabilis NIES-23]MBD2174994.1 hypothetical protein [Anabaena cylindrica FACHB-318]MBD2266650.1 hypothetical protein [Anabaena sp. FACHB-709]MBD2276256.1 hypothetical protein [Nostoc sp. PCC 7120 = FACHB-418]MBD2287219.1 hypothetical protein [Anabaena cylindrica FACHB-170]